MRRFRGDAVDLQVAVVLAAHVVLRISRPDRAEQRELRVLQRFRVGAGRRLHRGERDDLHQVVDDDVAQRADGIVEVPAVLDAEVLGHRDLDIRDVVAIPDRLDHRVREAQIQQLVGAHLPEEVVDPVQLRLVDRLVDFRRERARGLEVVAERLLDDHARGLCQVRVLQLLDHRPEQERGNLQVEDRAARVADGGRQALVRGLVGEVAADVGQARGEALEDLEVERLATPFDTRARVLAQVLERPVVARDADDRAVQEAALLQAVERVEGHHLREVPGDPEDHEHVGRGRAGGGVTIRGWRLSWHGWAHTSGPFGRVGGWLRLIPSSGIDDPTRRDPASDRFVNAGFVYVSPANMQDRADSGSETVQSIPSARSRK